MVRWIPQKYIKTNFLLGTKDVKSWYTNFPNSERIYAVKKAYESYPQKPVVTKVIITFLALTFIFINSAKITYK